VLKVSNIVKIREFTSADLPAVKRIWKECGWVSEDKAILLDDFFGVGHALLGMVDDEPECAVHHTPGVLRYMHQDLSLGAVTAVTTSHVARQGGIALKMTAELLAYQASQGHHVSALGIFDQGYYDKLGYGTGSYTNLIRFDPASLRVGKLQRPPKRLTVDDYDQIHSAMNQRRRSHGNVSLLPAQLMKAELKFINSPFGLGYFDGPEGELSHFIFGNAAGENGPYAIRWMAYQNGEQLRELLAVMKSLADQVNTFVMLEPAEIQLQDFLDRPIRHRRGTSKSDYENKANSLAFWQVRILDLVECISQTRLQTPPIAFNLKLTDPVSQYLESTSTWQGIGGEYTIELGGISTIESGFHESLPTLTATVGAFTRMWFGVRSASSLSITDNLSGSDTLLQALDDCLCLPQPHLAWDF